MSAPERDWQYASEEPRGDLGWLGGLLLLCSAMLVVVGVWAFVRGVVGA